MKFLNALFLFGLFCFYSCKSKQQFDKTDIQHISIVSVRLDLPAGYRYLAGRGIDSYAASIINNNNDTFKIEYGNPGIIYRLFDYPPAVWPLKNKAALEKSFPGSKSDPEQVVYSNTPRDDMDQAIFLKNYYQYDTINGLVVKIVQPKRIGNGKTGILVPVLPDSNSFCIFAKNLDSARHLEALQMFHSLRWEGKGK